MPAASKSSDQGRASAAPAMGAPRLERRAAGILLHLSSLPGPHGIGDLGPAAYRFVDFLQASGQRWWQMLPVVPVGPGRSPYSSSSAFAGNPLFVSLELLVQDGFLSPEDLAQAPEFSPGRTDYDAAQGFKEALLRKAYERFSKTGGEALDGFRAFCLQESYWLEDYGLFCALKGLNEGRPWSRWDEDLKRRRFRFWPREITRQAGEDSAYHQFVQYLFHAQWRRFEDYAAARGVGLIGDAPLYVAYESAELWAHPEIFRLDAGLAPEAVAGVPPDYFSKDGQLWGNPLYRWEALAQEGYEWWMRRLARAGELFKAVRLDHFIGFSRYWEVPATARTAKEGRWVKGPGADFFSTLRQRLPRLEIIAEDLGLVGPDVVSLRDSFKLPGIKVLEFSIADGGRVEDPPPGYPAASLACTGTHDNDTLMGWLLKRPDREFLIKSFNADAGAPHWGFIQAVYHSPAQTAIVPMQDVLGLGSEARMNLPGEPKGNWLWRLDEKALTPALSRTLAEMAKASGRE